MALSVHDGGRDAISALFGVTQYADGLVVAQVCYAAHIAFVSGGSNTASRTFASMVIGIATAVVLSLGIWSGASVPGHTSHEDHQTRAGRRHEVSAAPRRAHRSFPATKASFPMPTSTFTWRYALRLPRLRQHDRPSSIACVVEKMRARLEANGPHALETPRDMVSLGEAGN